MRTIKSRTDNETQVLKSRGDKKKKGEETEMRNKAQKIQKDQTVKITQETKTTDYNTNYFDREFHLAQLKASVYLCKWCHSLHTCAAGKLQLLS